MQPIDNHSQGNDWIVHFPYNISTQEKLFVNERNRGKH